jgi:hypothetical protein
MLEPLATVPELQIFMADETLDPVRFEQALRWASARIRAATNQVLTEVADDTVRLRGTYAGELWLPERPVTAVGAVTVDGMALASGLYSWSADGKLGAGAGEWPVLNAPTGVSGWGGGAAVVEVTYDHGYTETPDDLKALCLAMAARQLSVPDYGAVTQRSETIGRYTNSVSYGAARGFDDDERRILNRYRRRAGTAMVLA